MANSKSCWSQLLTILLVLLSALQAEAQDPDPGEPLFLTPYIQAGQVDQARNLSLVGPIKDVDVVSYSGYLTVDSDYNSNLFFWFFPATNDLKTAPVILWLQGGPGGSDMYGIFVEIGPYAIDSQLQLSPNNYTWIANYSVIFIDSPVGTGFSFTEADAGYATTEQDVAVDLASALRQFFSLFPEYVNNEFYIAGESYAGKYIPALGYELHVSNPDAEIKINLKGVAIGDGFVDPLTQTNYGSYLYGLGLIDQNQQMTYEKMQTWIETYINMGSFDQAFAVFDQLIFGQPPTVFTETTGLQNYYNFLETDEPPTYYDIYVDQPEVRQAIHVGELPFQNGTVVQLFMIDDMMNTTKPWLEKLIDNNYQVMLYNGQLDICVAYDLTMQMIDSMTWNTMDDYHAAPRLIWKVDPLDLEVAGYARPSHNFVEVLVRDAGHMVPLDQPRAALDLITRFIQGKPWTA